VLFALSQKVFYPVIPPQVEYTLTPLGKTLLEPIDAIRTWAKSPLKEVEQARDTFGSDL
jgi:Predicted transcriptional regulators